MMKGNTVPDNSHGIAGGDRLLMVSITGPVCTGSVHINITIITIDCVCTCFAGIPRGMPHLMVSWQWQTASVYVQECLLCK